MSNDNICDENMSENFEELTRLTQLRDQVYNKELILQAIVSKVVYNQPWEVIHLRQVNKSWLQAVAKWYKHSRTPLFHFKITEAIENGMEISGGKSCLDFLDNLQKSLTSRVLENKMPPIKLKIEDRLFFKAENYDIFAQILDRSASNLVELSIAIPEIGGNMPFIFPNIVLPNLRKFSLDIMDVHGNPDDAHSMGNANITYLMQFLFSASKNLQTVVFHSNQDMPHGSEFLCLTNTVTAIISHFAMRKEHLNLFWRNSLPNLQNLHMVIIDPDITGDMISKILTTFQETLKHFNLQNQFFAHMNNGRVQQLNVSVPHMPKLEFLSIVADNTELISSPSLDDNLPKLKILKLLGQSIPMLRKTLIGRKFEFVQDVEFSPKIPHNVDRRRPVPEEHLFGKDMFNLVHAAFPNLTAIDLCIDSKDLKDLQTLFEKMEQLERLQMLIRDTSAILNSNFWDSLLTGLTTDQLALWKRNPHIDFSDCQIRALKNLKKLSFVTLQTVECNRQPVPWMSISLISDAAFELAFLKMENLKFLGFGGRFLVSSEMARKWERMGRNFACRHNS